MAAKIISELKTKSIEFINLNTEEKIKWKKNDEQCLRYPHRTITKEVTSMSPMSQKEKRNSG